MLGIGRAEAEALDQERRGSAQLLVRGLFVLVSPAPMLEPPLHGRGAYRGVCASTVCRVPPAAGILARGPWEPQQVEVSWRSDEFEPDRAITHASDIAQDELRARGSSCSRSAGQFA